MNEKVKNALNSVGFGIRKYFIPIAITITTLALCKYVFFIGAVPSGSMEPTLKTNSFIVGVRPVKTVKVGDVVIFTQSAENQDNETDIKYIVKRVAATENETVVVNHKRYTVPEGCVFLLGDNINNSLDSRFWNNPYLPTENIVARVIVPNAQNARYFRDKRYIKYIK